MNMNCFDTRQSLRSHLHSGEGHSPEVESHLKGCELCQQWHFNELLKLEFEGGDIPEPREEMVDELINTAVLRGDRQRVSRFSLVAAVAVVALTLGLVVIEPTYQSQVTPDYEVSIIPETSELVDFVINSTAEQEVATVTIELADNLELQGFPGNKVVTWETPLVKGKNLLRLPVLLKNEDGGSFNVGLTYGSTSRELTIMVKADQSVPPRAALSA